MDLPKDMMPLPHGDTLATNMRRAAPIPAQPAQAAQETFALYTAVNDLASHIGMAGQVDSRHKAVSAVMDALHALDGGNVALRIDDLVEKAFMPHDQASRLAVSEFIAIKSDCAAAIAQQAAPASAPVDAAGERAAFEAWAVADGASIARQLPEYGGRYRSAEAQWAAWQARAALAAQRQAAPADSNSPEFAGIKTDAARYRWLRDEARNCGIEIAPIVMLMDDSLRPQCDERDCHGILDVEALDAAIAQARAAG